MKKINFDYQPKSYWGPQDLKTFYGSRIKGQIRKKMITEEVESGNIPLSLLEPEVSEELKDYQNHFHPQMMGGEYLPNYKNNEIEICRVVLDSTTLDVYSLRVRKNKTRHVYRIVDEYSNTFKLSQYSSIKPLKMIQIIQILNNCEVINYDSGEIMMKGIIRPHLDYMCDYHLDDYSKEKIINFVKVESNIYPEIEIYYEQQKEIWFKENTKGL